jgi:hypothetical protein
MSAILATIFSLVQLWLQREKVDWLSVVLTALSQSVLCVCPFPFGRPAVLVFIRRVSGWNLRVHLALGCQWYHHGWYPV